MIERALRPVVARAAWWLANGLVGYVLGASFGSATSGDVAFTLVGPVLLLGAFAIVVMTVLLAAWLGFGRRIVLSLTLMAGPPFLVAGWLLATMG